MEALEDQPIIILFRARDQNDLKDQYEQLLKLQ